MIKKFTFFFGSLCWVLNVMAQTNRPDFTLSQINAAFKNKDIQKIQPLLDSEFTIGTYAGRAALFSMDAILKAYRLDSFELKKVSESDSLILVEADIAGGKDSTTTFYFTNDYKLLRADLFDGLYGLDRNIASVKVAVIPFEEEDGYIYFQITLNESNKKLRFLFDTGSDGMMVSTELGESLGLKIAREQQASAVGGHIDIKVSENNIVHFNGFDLDKQSVAIFGNTNPNHDGIIGNTLLKRYITHVDYDKKEMVLYSLGKFDPDKNDKRLPVEVKTGNILLDANIFIKEGNPVPGKFTFDTGAGYTMIVFRPTVLKYRMLVNGFVQDSASTTVSMGMATPVFHGKAKKVSFKDDWNVADFAVTLMGSTQATANWKPEAAGSLGIKFISGYNFTVNLVDKYIAFEKRKSD